MDIKKHIRNISNINHKKTFFSKIRRINSPILFNKRIRNYLLINDNHQKIKNNNEVNNAKSIENKPGIIKRQLKKNKYNEINFFHIKKLYQKSPNSSNENSKIINYIKKKITFTPFNSKTLKKNSIDNIFNNKIQKDKKSNSSKKSISKIIIKKTNLKKYNLKKNFINKIYINKTNKKSFDSNKNIEKKYCHSSKYSISLDNILSKTITKNPAKNKVQSLEKINNLSEKKTFLKNTSTPVNKKKFRKITNLVKDIRKNLDIQNNKNLFEKNKKLYNYNMKKKSKLKSENMTDIIRHLTKTNLKSNNGLKQEIEKINNNNNNKINNNMNKNKGIISNNNIKDKLYSSKSKKSHKKQFKKLFNSREKTSDLIFEDGLSGGKNLNENYSTNDKSLNTKNSNSNKEKIYITQNIVLNKYNISERKQLYEKTNNSLEKDNDTFATYEFDIGNEQNNKINGVRTNNFDVKKPKEDNLKFSFMKEDIDSDISISASKIIIGNIDGYKDIIEIDKKNNQNKDKIFNGTLFNKKLNKNNNLNLLNKFNENSINNVNKKINNLSILLKKESDNFTFNDDNFSNIINITNNYDEISNTIIDNKINNNESKQLIDNYITDNLNKNGRNLYKENNTNFNTNSFFINTYKSDKNFSKNVYISNNQDDKLKILFNRDNNKKLKYNIKKNNFVNTDCKKGRLEEINDLNKNCTIY